MKKIIISLFVYLITFSLSPAIAQAQFGGLKNKIKNKVNKEIDKTVDEVLDGKSDKNTDTQKKGTDDIETSKRSRETGYNQEADYEVKYKYSSILRSCSGFLNYKSGSGLQGLSFDEEDIQFRAQLTNEKLQKVLSKNKGDNNYSSSWAECAEYVAQDGFQAAVFEEADGAYMGFDKEEAFKRLSRFSSDLAFISRVVLPNNTTMLESAAYAKKLADKLSKKIDADLSSKVSSNFHKENVNKIFFTSNPNINPATASASDFKTNFKAGDDIYGVVYFADKIQTYLDGNGRIIYGELQMKNGEGTGSNEIDYNGNFDKQKSYSVFVIYADASRYQNKTGSTYPTVSLNAEFLSGLPPRNIDIEATIGDDCKGSFKFDASDDNKLESMASNAKTLRQRIVSSKGLPKAGMKNASIENQLVAMFNSIGWSEKFTKTIITATDYGYKRGPTGIITGRTLTVVMLSKKSDGTCQYQDFTVIQPKTGSGYANFKRLSTGSQSDIGCDKL